MSESINLSNVKREELKRKIDVLKENANDEMYAILNELQVELDRNK